MIPSTYSFISSINQVLKFIHMEPTRRNLNTEIFKRKNTHFHVQNSTDGFGHFLIKPRGQVN